MGLLLDDDMETLRKIKDDLHSDDVELQTLLNRKRLTAFELDWFMNQEE